MSIVKGACPNYNSSEWIALEAEVGRFEAMKDWIEQDGIIRAPEEVLEKINYRLQAEEAAAEAQDATIKTKSYPVKPGNTQIEQRLLDSKTVRRKNNILFVKQHRHSEAINAVATINKEYGPDTVRITQVASITGKGGRTIFKVVVKPEGEQFTAFTKENLVFMDPSISTEPIEVDAKAMEQTFAAGAAIKMAQAYSDNLGVNYRMPTPDEAIVLTNKRWKGEKGFYQGNTVNLVTGLFTKDTVFHEFSHPVVRSIRYNNPNLFTKLYNKALATKEGQATKDFVKKEYADILTEGTEDFMEEVIVTSMTDHYKNQQNNVKESAGFIQYIKDLLYAIKQLMRKIFGQKIAVDKLKVDTSLEELADMLSKGGQFDLKIQNVKQSNVEAYVREQQDDINTLKNVDKKELAVLTEKLHNTVLNHLEKLKGRNYKEIADIFSDEFEATELSRMRSGMGPFKQKLDDKLDRLINDVTYTSNLSTATVNSLYHLQTLAAKIADHLKNLSADPNDKDGLQQMAYYQGLIDDWRNFIKDGITALDKSNISPSNKIYKLLTEIDNNLRTGANQVSKIRQTLLTPVISGQLKKMGKFIDKQYKDGYLSKKAYEELQITPEKIKLMLEGKISSDNSFNSFLEGYMYNQDPIVAAAAKFINDNYTDVMTGTQRDLNTFASDIKADLDGIGYTGRDPEALGKKVTVLDEIGYTDKDGNFVTKKVRSFISKVMGWRAPQAKRNYDLDQLRKQPRTDDNRKEIRKAEYDKDKHNAVYFNQPMHPEFYENLELFADEIGQEAREEYDQVRHDAEAFRDKMLSGMTDQEIKDGNEDIRRRYQNLTSLKKENQEPKSERDQEKAKRLRTFFDSNKKFYERKTYTKSFRTAYENYKQYLTDNNYTDEQYDKALEKWVNDNTVKKLKPEYKERVAEIQKKLAKISEGIGQSHTYFTDMYEETFKFRDEDFQIDGNRVLDGNEALAEKILKWETLMDQEKNSGIYNGLSGIEKTEFFGLLSELRGLRKKTPTQAFLDTFNSFLEEMDLEEFHKAIGSTEVNSENIDLVVKDEETIEGKLQRGVGKGGISLLNSLFKQNSEFEAWFQKSHRRVNKIVSGEVVGYRWERSYIWNTTEPVDKSNYESTALEVDKDGKPTKTIDRAPGFRYTYASLKPTFTDKNGNKVSTRTKKVVGETITNKGEWLPKSREQGAPEDSPYINQAYYDLQKNDPKTFKILQKVSQFHLDNQKGIGKHAKLYMDLPRFEKNTLETALSGNPLSLFGKKVKMWFGRSKDDAERGFNWSEVDFNIAKSDYFDEELSAGKVPIYGTSLIDEDVSSLDIFRTTTSYMLSAAMHRKRVEMLPTFKAMKSVLSNPDNAIKEITGFTEANQLNRGVLTYKDKKGKNVRLAAIEALMERELEGQNITGKGKDVKWLHQTMGFLMSRASFGFFALNAPSAIKNSLAAHMQIMIESAAGYYITPRTYGRGVGWAGMLMSEISGQTYEVGPKTLKVQITEIFDPARGRQEEKFGESISRTFTKDVVDGSWLYNFRKWTELHATMSLFGGMMYKQKVNRTVNGKTEKINYMDAWELDSKGQIKLKEGVDPEYGIGGEKFKAFREKANTVSKRLQGAYSRFDQPEANRYLLFRMMWYLRKFFMPMLMDRWNFRGKVWDPKLRYDIGSGELTQGFYITFTKLLLRTAMSVKYGLPKMGPLEKRAVIKMTTEVLSLYALSLLWNALFDYDPDDEDRFEKMKERSGVMPIPFVVDADPDHPFHLDGWLANHGLNSMLMVKAENDQWLPVPGLGLDNYMNTLYLKSFAYGPTIEVYVKAVTDAQRMMSGDQRAYYQQDVGPYKWQKEGSAKIWNHLGKMFGLAGTQADPVLLTKYSEWMQQPTRR